MDRKMNTRNPNVKEFNVDERLGPIVSGEHWGIIPFSLYKYQQKLNLKIHHIWILEWLIIHRWSKKDAYPSISALERSSGITRSYIQKKLKELEEKKKLIIVTPRYTENNGRASNYYDIQPLLDKLEELIKADPRSNYSRKESNYDPEDNDD